MKKIYVAIVCLVVVVAALALGVVLCPNHEDHGSRMIDGVNAPITNQMDRDAWTTALPAETELPVRTIIDDVRETVMVLSNWVIDSGALR